MGFLIAVDFDDVLCQTNATAAKWHNETYGTQMTLDDFHYYHWWKNPGWGNPSETQEKAKEFYTSNSLDCVPPVSGAAEALLALKDMGHRLVIVTTRSVEQREQTTAWIYKEFGPDIFESIHFTGDMITAEENTLGQECQKRLTKGELCRKLSASLLIDDAMENVLDCVDGTGGQVPALIFGNYEWGKRSSFTELPEDRMSFEERRRHEIITGSIVEWWREDTRTLPKGIWRVKDWPEVLQWVRGVGRDILNTMRV